MNSDKQPNLNNEPPDIRLDDLAKDWGVEKIDLPKAEVVRSLRNSYHHDNHEHLLELMEDTAAEFLFDNCPQFSRNIADMKAARSEERQQQIKDSQLDLLLQAKKILSRMAGIPEIAAKSEIEIAKEKIYEILQKSKAEQGDKFDPLKSLGILKENEDGEEIFVYPKGLFAKQTDGKWQTYIDAVRHHLKAAREYSVGWGTREDVMTADGNRRLAHNNVSMDVNDSLGLGWSIDEARRLVAKMRDERFPNVATGEKARTNDAIYSGMANTAVRLMRERLLPDYDSIPDPDLSREKLD